MTEHEKNIDFRVGENMILDESPDIEPLELKEKQLKNGRDYMKTTEHEKKIGFRVGENMILDEI